MCLVNIAEVLVFDDDEHVNRAFFLHLKARSNMKVMNLSCFVSNIHMREDFANSPDKFYFDV